LVKKLASKTDRSLTVRKGIGTFLSLSLIVLNLAGLASLGGRFPGLTGVVFMAAFAAPILFVGMYPKERILWLPHFAALMSGGLAAAGGGLVVFRMAREDWQQFLPVLAIFAFTVIPQLPAILKIFIGTVKSKEKIDYRLALLCALSLVAFGALEAALIGLLISGELEVVSYTWIVAGTLILSYVWENTTYRATHILGIAVRILGHVASAMLAVWIVYLLSRAG
jgi:hypothetical protein